MTQEILKNLKELEAAADQTTINLYRIQLVYNLRENLNNIELVEDWT